MRRWSLLLTGLALTVRLLAIGRESLWYDETFTAWLAALPLDRMIVATLGDVHPPLWYVIEWVTVRLIGQSEAALRLPAALCSAWSVGELYRLIRLVAGHREGLIAGGLAVIMPGLIYYGQEARMYSLLALLILIASRALLAGQWRVFVPCAALALYTHNLAAPYLVVLAGIALARYPVSLVVRRFAVVGALWLPWSAGLVYQLSHVVAGFWLPPPGSIGGALYYLFYSTVYVRVPELLQFHALIAVLAVTLVALYTLRDDWRRLLPVGALAFGPSVLLYLVSVCWRPVLLDRALVPAGQVVTGLWGAALARMSRQGRAALLAVLAPTLAAGLYGYYFEADAARPPVTDYSNIIRQGWHAGDVIYHINLASLITTAYYLPDEQFPAYLLPQANDLSQSLTEETKAVMGIRSESLASLGARGYRRAWLLWVDTPVVSDIERTAARHAVDRYQVVRTYHLLDEDLASFTVVLLDLRKRNVTARNDEAN